MYGYMKNSIPQYLECCLNLYSLGKYFSTDSEDGEVKKWVSM